MKCTAADFKQLNFFMFFVRNKIVLDSSQNDFPDSNFIRLVLLGMFKNLIHTLEMIPYRCLYRDHLVGVFRMKA